MEEMAFGLVIAMLLELRIAVARGARRIDRLEIVVERNKEFIPSTDKVFKHA